MNIRKRLIFILSAAAIIVVSFFLGLPAKAVYRILPVFINIRYGISTNADLINGGFGSGIVLENARLTTETTEIECKDVVTDIKFSDILFPHRDYYNIYLENPKVCINNLQYSFPRFRFALPFWLKTRISLSNAQLFIKGFGRDFGMTLNGMLDINKKYISARNLKMSLGELEFFAEGSIDRNRKLDLSANFSGSDNKFVITGQLDKPEIQTRWGNIETKFQIENIRYEDGELLIPDIAGNIYIPGFQPIDMRGELYLDREYMKFKNINILEMIKMDGLVSKNRFANIHLCMDNVDGSRFTEKTLKAMDVFLSTHKISADFNIFGAVNNLQAGGTMELFSTPMKIACRYRENKFSFRSLGGGALDIFGTIYWDKVRSVKIKGSFSKMDIKDFLALFGRNTTEKNKGIISGQFKITGETESPLIELKVDIENAEFGDMKFDVAYLNIKGTGAGPLYLQHSMVYYKEVPAELSGYIDPKAKDIFRNIEIRPSADNIMLEGINIVKESGDEVVTFGKDINENISIKLKSIVSSDPEENGVEKKPELEVEYKLQDNKNLMIKVQENEGTIGVKQKVQF